MRSSIQKVVGTLPRERRTQRVSFSHLPAAVCRVCTRTERGAGWDA